MKKLKIGLMENRMSRRHETQKRLERKQEHIALTVETGDGPGSTRFEDIRFVPQGIGELAWADVSLALDVWGRTWKAPFYINALTGGSEEGQAINRSLAKIASEYGIPMAVGSQRIALDDQQTIKTFTVVREINPDGIIWANLNAKSSVSDAKRAIAMVDADAIQLHLNMAQELMMLEGDRDFRGTAEAIANITTEIKIPVIAKEVGNGLSAETAESLMQLGVSGLDVGGSGGTNFPVIENRRYHKDDGFLADWGLPTAISLLETVKTARTLTVFASGGIRDGLTVAKALAVGATAVGLGGELLRILVKEGEKAAFQYLERLINELTAVMLLMNAANLDELQRSPYLITGPLREWLEIRQL